MVSHFFRTVITFCLCVFSAHGHSTEVAKTLRTEKHVNAVLNHAVRQLKRGDPIDQQDIIKTGEQARASFRFNEGTVITLGAKTEMVVSEFIHTNKKKSAAFEFATGAFRIVTGLITKTESPRFTVDTPMGAIGVRGTDFWGGNLANDQSIDVILLDSEHPLTIENEFGKVIIDTAGYGSTLQPGKAPTKPVQWSKEKLAKAVKTISFPPQQSHPSLPD